MEETDITQKLDFKFLRNKLDNFSFTNKIHLAVSAK